MSKRQNHERMDAVSSKTYKLRHVELNNLHLEETQSEETTIDKIISSHVFLKNIP